MLETIRQTTIKCSCGDHYYTDTSIQCCSSPPQYKLFCKKCGGEEFEFCHKVNFLNKVKLEILNKDGIIISKFQGEVIDEEFDVKN